jgi:hypothetical protein
MIASIRNAALAFVLLAGYSVSAQQFIAPDAPSSTATQSHKFFDRNNKLAFGTLAGLIAIDAVTTQQLTNSYRAVEGNPLWQPMVRQGWQGEMAASAIGYGAAIGVAYAFHKTGHHKLERFANWFTVSMEAANDAHNLILVAQ